MSKKIVEQLRECSTRSKKYLLGLLGDITGTVADAIDEVAKYVSEVDEGKVGKTNAVPVTIPVTGWTRDSDASYPQYYDIEVTGITAKDRAEITIAPGSLDTAEACGLCPTNETLAGRIRVRAASIPQVAIAAEYWLENGKE